MAKLGLYLLAVLVATILGIPTLFYSIGPIVVLLVDGQLTLSAWHLLSVPCLVVSMFLGGWLLTKVSDINHRGFLALMYSTYAWGIALLVTAMSIHFSVSRGYDWWARGFTADRWTAGIATLVALCLLGYWYRYRNVALPDAPVPQEQAGINTRNRLS